jgi:hypothetical protein
LTESLDPRVIKLRPPGEPPGEPRCPPLPPRRQFFSISSRKSSIMRHFIPFPGSSVKRATFSKALFRDKLWRIEFCSTISKLHEVRRDRGLNYLPPTTALRSIVSVSACDVIVYAIKCKFLVGGIQDCLADQLRVTKGRLYMLIFIKTEVYIVT